MSNRFCALCQSDIGDLETTSNCPGCGATYHQDCHQDNGGCGNYGCPLVPSAAEQVAAASPTVWGREIKRCPACDREIRAVALRCRHCGADFATVEHIAADAYRAGREQQERVARLRRRAGACFVGGVIPCIAPLVLVIGVPILVRERSSVRRLPPLYRLLGAAGLGLALLWVVVGAVVLFLSREP